LLAGRAQVFGAAVASRKDNRPLPLTEHSIQLRLTGANGSLFPGVHRRVLLQDSNMPENFTFPAPRPMIASLGLFLA